MLIVSPSKGSALTLPSPKYISKNPSSFSCTYQTSDLDVTEEISFAWVHAEVEVPEVIVIEILEVSTFASVIGNLWFCIWELYL